MCVLTKERSAEIASLALFFDSYKSIVEFIDAQFEAYLQEELKIKRTLHSYHDTRIHACLYFIAPTGHSLKSLDLVTMKKLDSKVSFTSLYQTVVGHFYIVVFSVCFVLLMWKLEDDLFRDPLSLLGVSHQYQINSCLFLLVLLELIMALVYYKPPCSLVVIMQDS